MDQIRPDVSQKTIPCQSSVVLIFEQSLTWGSEYGHFSHSPAQVHASVLTRAASSQSQAENAVFSANRGPELT